MPRSSSWKSDLLDSCTFSDLRHSEVCRLSAEDVSIVAIPQFKLCTFSSRCRLRKMQQSRFASPRGRTSTDSAKEHSVFLFNSSRTAGTLNVSSVWSLCTEDDALLSDTGFIDKLGQKKKINLKCALRELANKSRFIHVPAFHAQCCTH